MKKHIPQRTCVGCHRVASKRELLRIVRTPDGHVVADPTGKKAGRGAYLCRQRVCWDEILSGRGRLEHALKLEAPANADDLMRLREFAMALPQRFDQDAAIQTKTK